MGQREVLTVHDFSVLSYSDFPNMFKFRKISHRVIFRTSMEIRRSRTVIVFGILPNFSLLGVYCKKRSTSEERRCWKNSKGKIILKFPKRVLISAVKFMRNLNRVTFTLEKH